MDDQAKRKALFRAKLNAQKKDKRIDSPLVRYNELDQPVCRVCDMVLKSEAYWDGHQSSRRHHEAIKNLKANAAGRSGVNNIKTEAPAELPKSRPTDLKEQKAKTGTSTELPKRQSSSVLPSDFFDHNAKRLKTGNDVEPDSHSGGIAQSEVISKVSDHSKKSSMNAGSEGKQIKGALPEGFFDDKEADLRAHGIKLVKPDVKDEYKEFEKLIQEDLQEVDDRLEEEEIDAAEMIEEAETLEQKAYRERVELLKRKKMELKTKKSEQSRAKPQIPAKESQLDDSLSDDDSDSDTNYTVDWRAQHL
ncbi:zinc finger protein 830 [Benincasa hispida]|uniref:zinc finger protein 830 n=1 Tax=Benincasa hispida TaxID=102211 RepID=UPI0019007198|nr:zinc finger protein 830 [Benincasa hispida]XP_038881212.1 zinc finger protein 830 [Benincasa hispida]